MVAQNKKLLKCPENTECINKLQLIPKMEKYTAVKMYGLQLNTVLYESQKHEAVGIIDCCSCWTSVITLGGFSCLCSSREPMKQYMARRGSRPCFCCYSILHFKIFIGSYNFLLCLIYQLQFSQIYLHRTRIVDAEFVTIQRTM